MADDREWLEKHLKILMDIGKDTLEADKSLADHQPTYDKGPWTGLKLICLNYYLPVYLNILAKRGRVGYVDIFSGPGLDRIGRRGVPVPGSPTISVVHSQTDRSFSLYIFGDINPDYVGALDLRLESMKAKGLCSFDSDSVENDVADANKRIRDAPTMLGDGDIGHCFLFVDPEGLELKWASLEYFAKNFPRSDWIVLFPSTGLNRLLGRKDSAAWQLIREFIGPGSEELNDGSSEADAIRMYRGNLASLGKEISTEIMISGGGSFHYHLIPAVKRTRHNSPWFSALLEAKNRIERLSGEALEIVSQQIDGIQKVL